MAQTAFEIRKAVCQDRQTTDKSIGKFLSFSIRDGVSSWIFLSKNDNALLQVSSECSLNYTIVQTFSARIFRKFFLFLLLFRFIDLLP